MEESQEILQLMGMLAGIVDLGDERLNKRLIQVVQEAFSAQGCSLAQLSAAGGEASRKALQRFVKNGRVELPALRSALYRVSLEQLRLSGAKTVVSAFDPTNLDFSAQRKNKGGLKPVGKGHVPGYVWLNMALIDPDSGRLFGVGHQTLDLAGGPDDQRLYDYTAGLGRTDLAEEFAINPKQQFLVHARAVDELVPKETELIYVADRELDDAFSLRGIAALEHQRHFVIRSDEQRVVSIQPVGWLEAGRKLPSQQKQLRKAPDQELVEVYLRDLAGSLPLEPFDSLGLDGRGRVCFEGSKPARRAKLSIGALGVCLLRRSTRAVRAKLQEQPLWLHLVVVHETDPPQGVKPLHWTLLTDLPVSTPEQRARVVQLYRCRPRIEEFFRTTNDVLSLECSRLRDAPRSARLMVLLTLKAMFLDALRATAGLPAGVPPTSEQRAALRSGAKEAERIEKAVRHSGKRPPKLSLKRRAIMLLGLLARHGGWVATNRAHLGNAVLLRGLHAFLPLVSYDHYLWLFGEVGS